MDNGQRYLPLSPAPYPLPPKERSDPMARPQTVHGLKPDATVRANAQRIVATRTTEFFGFAPYMANPAYVSQLHDMRIAAKRLRYALEIFAPALDTDTAGCIGVIKEFQEIVGDIHDDDVLMEIVRAHLETRVAEHARALAALATAARDDEPVAAVKARLRVAVVDDGAVAEQVALAAMIARTARHRRARHAELLTRWDEWRAAGLRERLEALAVDLPSDLLPAVPVRASTASSHAGAGEDLPVASTQPRADGKRAGGRARRGVVRAILRRKVK